MAGQHGRSDWLPGWPELRAASGMALKEASGAPAGRSPCRLLAVCHAPRSPAAKARDQGQRRPKGRRRPQPRSPRRCARAVG
eukprot:scaffold9411_cov59-Phaeocystis_antarctica.AAC.4